MEPDPRGEHAPSGKRWIRRCPRCGKELPAEQRQCPNDGAALGEPVSLGRPLSEGDRAWEATVKRDILIGTRVGEYVVRRRIGEGGMGIVYEAEQPQIGRKVAVKVLRPDVRSRQNAGLAGEGRASGRIRHRAVVDVFGYGEIPDIGQYLVMEYLEGRPLDMLLAERGSLTVPEVLWLLDEVLSGLGAAHAEGVIHRDLKPSNLFVVSASGGSQYVKILDFGLAKRTEGRDPRTRGLLLGTPEYMAPEMARGQPVSGRTDLYSLGVIAFEMLTGQRPFTGETPLKTAAAHVQQAPPRPSKLARVPRELDALVLRLLEKEPARRPADAAAARREVKALAQWLGVVTKIGKLPERVERQIEETTQPELEPGPEPSTRVVGLGRRWWPWAVLGVAGLWGGVVWMKLRTPEPVAPVAPAIAEPPPAPASAEPSQEELLKRIAALRRRVEASAPPGGSPNPAMLTWLGREDAAARAAPDGPARTKVARSLDTFEQQFERSGELKPP